MFIQGLLAGFKAQQQNNINSSRNKLIPNPEYLKQALIEPKDVFTQESSEKILEEDSISPKIYRSLEEGGIPKSLISKIQTINREQLSQGQNQGLTIEIARELNQLHREHKVDKEAYKLVYATLLVKAQDFQDTGLDVNTRLEEAVDSKALQTKYLAKKNNLQKLQNEQKELADSLPAYLSKEITGDKSYQLDIQRLKQEHKTELRQASKENRAIRKRNKEKIKSLTGLERLVYESKTTRISPKKLLKQAHTKLESKELATKILSLKTAKSIKEQERIINEVIANLEKNFPAYSKNRNNLTQVKNKLLKYQKLINQRHSLRGTEINENRKHYF